MSTGKALFVATWIGGLSVLPAMAAEPKQIQAAAEKSLQLLQRCSPEFYRQTGCVACHQQSVTSLAIGEAQKRAVSFDPQSAREQIQLTALMLKSFQDRFEQRVDHPIVSAPSVGFILLGMAAEGYPPDESTQAMVIAMAGRQSADGAWSAFGHRPPLEYSRIGATALAVRALQLYGPPAQSQQMAQRITRAREWLVAAKPASNSDHGFRLLGCGWTGADKALLAEEVAELRKQQRDDGGWGQIPELGSDAYATGLTLFALHVGGGVAAGDDAYQRGVEYLLRTQLKDGSWLVKSRSFPFQPYFESGFPHGHDQWISAMATGWSTVALLYAVPVKIAERSP